MHPDVRRTLDDDQVVQRGGARAGGVDRARPPTCITAPTTRRSRQAADDHMGLLTPVIKGVLTDTGFANTVMAQQMFGGHGYIVEHGMEQFVRDARIAMLYEGANGIQALDLVGRKLPKDGGRALQAFFAEVQGFIKEQVGRRRDEALRRAARQGARPSAAGDDVVHGQRAWPSPTTPAPARPTTCTCSAWSRSATCGRGWRRRRRTSSRPAQRTTAHERQARHRALLHGARAAGDRGAARPHQRGRGQHDGIAGRDVLTRARTLARVKLDERVRPPSRRSRTSW